MNQLLESEDLKHNRSVGVVVRNIAIGAGGMGSIPMLAKLEQSVANVSPLLRLYFGAVMPSS